MNLKSLNIILKKTCRIFIWLESLKNVSIICNVHLLTFIYFIADINLIILNN